MIPFISGYRDPPVERGDSSFPESEKSEGRVSSTVARVPFLFYFIFDLIATEIKRGKDLCISLGCEILLVFESSFRIWSIIFIKFGKTAVRQFGNSSIISEQGRVDFYSYVSLFNSAPVITDIRIEVRAKLIEGKSDRFYEVKLFGLDQNCERRRNSSLIAKQRYCVFFFNFKMNQHDSNERLIVAKMDFKILHRKRVTR